MLGTLGFVSISISLMLGMVYMISDAHFSLKIIAVLTLMINVMVVLWGILGDPGVPEATYLHYTK